MGHIPVDKGWSWFTVLGAAWCMFSVVASFKSQGLLFVEFVEEFGASSYLTAWMMGITACGMSLFSPAATYLAKRYSCRLVVLTGSCLCASAAFFTSFATNIYFVICVYGGITGIGYAFMYGPGLMLIGVYFDKRRTLANGLALSGASVGQLVIPLMMRCLIKQYDVFGALRIYSAFLLHGWVAAMLMRPPEFYTQSHDAKDKSEEDISKNTVPLPLISNNDKNLTELNATRTTHLDLSIISSPQSTPCMKDTSCVQSESSSIGTTAIHETIPTANPTCSTKNNDIGDLSVQNGLELPDKTIEIKTTEIIEVSPLSSPVNQDYGDKLTDDQFLTEGCPDKVPALKFDNSDYRHDNSLRDGSGDSGLACTSVNVSEICDQKPGPSCAMITQGDKEYVLVGNPTHESSPKKCGKVPCFTTCFTLYRWDHLTNTLFLIYIGACAIGNSAYVDHSMLIPPYAKSIGVSKDMAAWLLATVGVGDFIGRILGGWFADFKIIKRNIQMSAAMMLIGVTTLICTCFPSTWALCVLCITLGLVGGTYVSMYTVVLIDFLGLSLFPSAFGLMIMFQGMFNTVLPSLLGLLKDVTGNYQASFSLLGILMVFSGSLLLWEPCARRYEQRKQIAKH